MRENLIKGKTLRELQNTLFKDSENAPIWVNLTYVTREGKIVGGRCRQTTYKKLMEHNDKLLDMEITIIGMGKITSRMSSTKLIIPEFYIYEIKEDRK